MMDARVRIPLKTCIRREPNPQACTPPGFEWISGYLNQNGGEMSDYGRNWLLDKWDESYQAAIQTAEQEYQSCLQDRIGQQIKKPAAGLQLRVASKLDGRTLAAQADSNDSDSDSARSTQVNVHFSSTGGTPLPCDPFDPDPPSNPIDPNAPPVSVPKSVFWASAVAYYDLDALQQAIEFPGQLFNPDNPQSVRYMQLTPEGVTSAVRIAGHTFHPIPPNVEVVDDLRTEIQVTSMRLDVSSESADSGGVLATWSVYNTPQIPYAYVDLGCYYWGGCGNLSPHPVYSWANLTPAPCITDLTFRAQASPICVIRVLAGNGELLDTITLTINRVGTIDARPIVTQHRLFNSPGTPLLLPQAVELTPATMGETREVVLTLPACVAGKVELAPDTIQDYVQFPQDNVIGVEVVAGDTPDTLRLRLTRLGYFYHWDRDLDIRLVPIAVDVGYPPSGWWPHVFLRVAIAWDGCGAFLPDRDSQVRAAIVGWSASDLNYPPPLRRWRHQLQLKVLDHAPPCDAFYCVWGNLRVTWPDGTLQTQQIFCVPGDIDQIRTFTRELYSSSPPTIQVELELRYGSAYRRRRANGTGFDHLEVPGPVIRQLTLTP